MRYEAQVFTCDDKGGNPVTVFLFPNRADIDFESRCSLAKTCGWESAFVLCGDRELIQHQKDDQQCLPDLYFHVPAGEEIGFCAHAAIGASVVYQTKIDAAFCIDKERVSSLFRFRSGNRIVEVTVNKVEGTGELELSSEDFEEKALHQHSLISTLLHEIGLESEHVYLTSPPSQVYSMVDSNVQVEKSKSSYDDSPSFPSIINSSIARFKTLIAVKSIEVLRLASIPKHPDTFRDICDKIGSTGVYLYCKINRSTYECRQFPRASGYPEDPATGIAATTLAASLRIRKLCPNNVVIYQGTEMGRRSRISVRFSTKNSRHLGNNECKEDRIFCSGAVIITD